MDAGGGPETVLPLGVALRFTSVADGTVGATNTSALESSTSLIVPEADVHPETLDQAVQDKAARDGGGHGKKSWSWKSGDLHLLAMFN